MSEVQVSRDLYVYQAKEAHGKVPCMRSWKPAGQQSSCWYSTHEV